ncbi:MAG: tetratricopeptide repeat protein [Endomicrobiaceae bacterium]|nr:tetratricopeptide repeat protein [Endomicrobiaceae bacterium]
MIKKIILMFSLLLLLTNLFAEEAVISQARQLAENGDYYKSLMEYTKILKTEKEDSSLFFERGNVKYELNNYNGAIGDYTDSLALEVSSQTYISRGKAELLTEQYGKALEDFNEALKMEESAEIYALMSDANFKKGNYAEAIENYTKAIKLLPAAYFYENRGMIYQNIKDYDNAIQDYTKAIEMDKENIDYYVLRYELYNIVKNFDLAEEDKAAIDTIKGDYDSAIKKLSGILNNKQDYLIHYKIGLLKNNIKDYDGAINSFTNSLDLKNTPEAFFERGKSKIQLKKYNGAIFDYENSLKLKKISNTYFEIAKTYCLMKKYEQSIEFFNKALKSEHENTDIAVSKMEALYCLERYKEILSEISKLNFALNDIRLIDLKAKAEYKLGMYDEALNDLESSLTISSQLETYLLIAEIYEKTKEYRKAILNYSIAINIEKENVGFVAKQNLINLYSKRGSLYLLINRPDLAQADKGYQDMLTGSYQNNVAIADFTKALEIKQSPEVYIARGNLKLKNNDTEEAISDFSKALELKKYVLSYLSMGQAQMQIDNDDEALKNFNSALECGTDKEEVYAALAKLMEKEKDTNKAIMYYTKALDIKKKRAYYLARANLYEKMLKEDLAIADKGNIKFMFGNYKEAIKDYTKSLEIYENSFVFAKRGECEEKLGKYEDALNDYIKAIELDKSGKFTQLKSNLLGKMSKEQKVIFELKQFEKKLFPE